VLDDGFPEKVGRTKITDKTLQLRPLDKRIGGKRVDKISGLVGEGNGRKGHSLADAVVAHAHSGGVVSGGRVLAEAAFGCLK